MKTKDNELNVCISHPIEIAVGKQLHIEIIVNASIWKTNYCKVLFNRHMENPSIVRDLSVKSEGNNTKVYSLDISFDMLGNYFFFFLMDINGEEKALKLNRDKTEVLVLDQHIESPYWKILVTNDFKVPEWAKGAICYQIIVDRFFKSEKRYYPPQPGRNYRIWGHYVNWHRDSTGEFHNNDFFGGNLKGIEEKLPYLHSLGVKIVYLSPIVYSVNRYERYAATDHMQIDPDVGTFEDLKDLHEACHALGMYLIIDFAFNHCHTSNPIFIDATTNPDSVYKDWFEYEHDGTPKWWSGYEDMPQFNEYNKGYQKYIYDSANSVVAKFAALCDGLRIDLGMLLESITKRGIRNRANMYGPHFVVGEDWDTVDISELGSGIDAPTCYTLSDPIYKYVLFGQTHLLVDSLQYLLDNYPQETLDSMLISMDTHDTIRELTILGKKQFMRSDYRRTWDIDIRPTPWHRNNTFYTDEFREWEFLNDKLTPEEYAHAVKDLKIISLIQYFLIGNPCIYYGTEAGLYGWKDPNSRKCFPWDNMDYNLVNHHMSLGNFRNKFYSAGSRPKVLYYDNELFVFKRGTGRNQVFCATNASESSSRKIIIPEEFRSKERFSIDANDDTLNPKGGIVILNN